MHSSLTAVVLCLLTQTAAAECAMTASLAGNAQPAHPIMTVSSTAATPAMRGSGALIKTAAAGTHDTPAQARATPARPTQSANAHDDHPPRSGTAMLLTAIALMSGIALRRYGSNTQ